MPLYLKQSDQKGKQGEAIFDPVGTNEHIKLSELCKDCTREFLFYLR